MELGTIHVTFPIFRFTSTIYHSTPRKPTVFERMLLKLHERFSSSEMYSHMSLRHIFEQILCVPDSEVLIRPVLDNLIDLELFKCSKHYGSLEEVTLGDLERTARGDEILRNDILPAVAAEHVVKHTYDPIHGLLLDSSQQHLLRSDRLSFSISEAPFVDMYPSEMIAGAIPSEKPTWWTPATQINRIERLRPPLVLWKEQNVRVCLEEDGNVRTECGDKELSEYLKRLPGELLFNDLIRPFLIGGKETPLWETALQKNDYAAILHDVEDFFPVPQFSSRVEWKGKVHFVRELPGLLSVPEKASSRTAIIVFEAADTESDVQVYWNEEQDGVCIRYLGELPGSEVFYSDGKNRCLGAAIFGLRLNGVVHKVPLAFAYAQEYVPTALQKALTKVEEELGSSARPEDCLTLAFWQPISEVWRKLLAHVTDSEVDFAGACERLGNYRQCLKRLSQQEDIQTWDQDICELFVSYTERPGSAIRAEDLKAPIEALACCDIQDPICLTNVFEAALSKLQPPDSLDSTEAILALFDPLRPALNIPFSSALYTPEVLVDCFNSFAEDGFESRMKDRNSLEQTLRSLKIDETRLKRVVGCSNMLNLDSDLRYSNTVRSVNVHETRGYCAQWLRIWDAFFETESALRELVQNTNLERIHANIAGYHAFLGKFVAEVPDNIRSVYVVDTNVFIDQPNILSKFRPYELIIVSKKVVDELDDKKKSERLYEPVMQATRALRDYSGKNLRYENADLSFLPEDYRAKGDNLILSVALKYKPCNPILLTADVSLTVKCQMEGLRTMTLPDFERRQVRGHSIHIAEIKKQDKGKKHKNRTSKHMRR